MDRKKYNVYPRDFALHVLGRSSTELNSALESWASVILRHTWDNAKRFKPAEWGLLAELLGEVPLESIQGNPERVVRDQFLAAAERDKATVQRWFPARPDEALRQLATKLGALTFGETWALIYTLRFYSANRDQLADATDWWDARHRLPVQLRD